MRESTLRLVRSAILIAACVLVCQTVAWAQTTVTLNGLQFGGTVQGYQNGGLLVSTPSGLVTVPTSSATISVGGVRLQVTQWQTVPVGTPVNVAFSPGPVVLGPVQQQLVTLQSPRGTYLVPVTCIPETVKGKTKVYVQLPNGNIVRVPLNAALNMQRSQGAIILGMAAPQQKHHKHEDEDHGRGHGHGDHDD